MPDEKLISVPGETSSISAHSPLPSSYRDRAGFMICDAGVFKRVITGHGIDDYNHYMSSGLHGELVRNGQVLDHHEEAAPQSEPSWKRLLVPEQLLFVSYPFEWSFDQLKDAALLTLDIQRQALARGLTLKDASPFNVQFRGSKSVFIDTLSFERDRGGPWVAYEQFCRQFLAPLLAMRYMSPDANKFLKAEIDGFPLDRISRRLPKRTYLQLGPLLHIHLHARAMKKRPEAGVARQRGSKAAGAYLVASLKRSVSRIQTPSYAPTWTSYYEESRFYSQESQESKVRAVRELAHAAAPKLVFDLGANTGLFSQHLAEMGAECIAFDNDPGCVNRLYVRQRELKSSHILPLVMDLTNPSPGLGFDLNSTLSLFQRSHADLVLALALMHHLRVTANLPLRRIAEVLSRLGNWILIEWVPPSDPAVSVLTQRQNALDDYSLPSFLREFGRFFELRESRPLIGSERKLFLFQRLG